MSLQIAHAAVPEGAASDNLGAVVAGYWNSAQTGPGHFEFGDFES